MLTPTSKRLCRGEVGQIGKSVMDETILAMRFAANLEKRREALNRRKQRPDANGAENAAAPGAFPPPPSPPAAMLSQAVVVDDTPLNHLLDHLSAVENAAAVSGRFNPDDLVATVEEASMRQVILSRLEPLCNVETVAGEIRWVLKQKARETILSRIRNQGDLRRLLAADLPPTDAFGERLREILRNGA